MLKNNLLQLLFEKIKYTAIKFIKNYLKINKLYI